VLEFGLLETKAAGQALAVRGPHLKAGRQTGCLTLHFLKNRQNIKNLFLNNMFQNSIREEIKFIISGGNVCFGSKSCRYYRT
jgi:hypothetical protein